MIDILDIKNATYLNFYIEEAINHKKYIYCENTKTKERVIVSEVNNEIEIVEDNFASAMEKLRGTPNSIRANLNLPPINLLTNEVSIKDKQIEELKNENKMLRDSWDDMFKKWETQIHKIGRAIELINENAILSDEWTEIKSSGSFIPTGKIDFKSLNKKKVEELLKILKGK